MVDRNISEIKELILEILYGNPQFRYTEKALEELIAVIFQDKFRKTLDVKKFTQALKDLVDNEFVECYEMAVPPGKVMTIEGEKPQIFTDKKKKFYKLTRKGISRIQDELKGLTFKQFRERWTEVIGRIDGQAQKVSEIENNIEEIFSKVTEMRDEVKKTKVNVIQIKNEVDVIRKEFYGRILQIFSIFVAVFAFIIVGFTQIPILVDINKDFGANLLNVSAVFLPLLGVLLILMIAAAWIVKRTLK